ncbi:MAG: polysaccharide deacetylase family protein [Burkholderiales bacterium]|nr:polysaccharide deacetylase family protein [Burkholderiales bacterium]
MPHLCLKVDVDTLRGTLEGVPRLIELFRRENVGATFLFSMGPDHTGRALKRIFRPGFLAKVRRTSVRSNYGLKTLLYGTLLPGPDIGKRGADVMRATRDAGFECGIHCWDHVVWQDGVMHKPDAWARRQMQRAHERYEKVFGEPALTCGAAGWQMSREALREQGRLGYRYATDSRVDGPQRDVGPFWPLVRGEAMPVPQVPTTLPTLDELLGVDDCTAENVHLRLLQATVAPRDHVFTLHAELEGLALFPVMERLLTGWRDQGYTLCTTELYFSSLDLATLPFCEVRWGSVAGRSGDLFMQGPRYLASASALSGAPAP